MWDERKVQVLEVLKGGYSLSIRISLLNKKSWWILNIYGPNDPKERKYLWKEINSIAAYVELPWAK